MSSKRVAHLGSGELLEAAVHGGAAIENMPLTQLDTVPVVQWLSEALQLQVLASVEVLRARLRVARERLRDGSRLHNTLGSVTTLLATDLEGFTPMLERLGDMRAQELMHIHNDLLRACLKRYHGREVAHTGDGMIVAFRAARNAMRCAIAMQRCLSAHNDGHPDTPLRVRIGLHAGIPLPEEDRLFGTCVNVTVRVCNVTEPGAISASDAVLSQLEGPEFRLVDRGRVPLKGIAAPLRLHLLSWQHSLPAELN